jgi:adenylate kinase
VKIFGMYENIPDVIKALKVDMLVVACIISDEKIEELKEMLKPLNVSMSLFTFNEIDILKNENKKG